MLRGCFRSLGLADGRCSWAVLYFLSYTDVGRWMLADVEDDSVSVVSELEVREWLEEQGVSVEEPGRGRSITVPPHAGLQGVCRRGLDR